MVKFFNALKFNCLLLVRFLHKILDSTFSKTWIFGELKKPSQNNKINTAPLIFLNNKQIRHDMKQHNVKRHDTTRHNTTQHNTTQHDRENIYFICLHFFKGFFTSKGTQYGSIGGLSLALLINVGKLGEYSALYRLISVLTALQVIGG